jgi:hypothetical protein
MFVQETMKLLRTQTIRAEQGYSCQSVAILLQGAAGCAAGAAHVHPNAPGQA